MMDKLKILHIKGFLIWFLLGAVIVLSFTLAVYFYTQYALTGKKAASPPEYMILGEDQSVLENITQTDWVSKIGRLVALPTQENPQVYILMQKDIENFKNDPLLRKSQIGDVLLVYEKFRLIVLFNPKINKVVGTKEIPVQQQVSSNPGLTSQPTVTNETTASAIENPTEQNPAEKNVSPSP